MGGTWSGAQAIGVSVQQLFLTRASGVQSAMGDDATEALLQVGLGSATKACMGLPGVQTSTPRSDGPRTSTAHTSRQRSAAS